MALSQKGFALSCQDGTTKGSGILVESSHHQAGSSPLNDLIPTNATPMSALPDLVAILARQDSSLALN